MKSPIEKVNIILTMITLVITTYISYQSFQLKAKIDGVENSISKAKLVKDLLDNLSSFSEDKKIKKDVALIILNRTINQDEQTKLMVAEIAEQIYKENINQVKKMAENFDSKPQNKGKTCDLNLLTGSAFPTSVVAFNVLEQNNPQRASSILKSFGKKVVPSNNKSDRVLPTNCVEKLNRRHEFLNSVVWLQFNDKSRRSELKVFAEKLDKIGWKVPKNNNCLVGEYTEKGYTWKDDKEPISTVRFYHISDRGKAERIQKLAKDFFKQSFDLDDMSVTNSNIPFGQIEVWIYFNQDPSNQDSSNQDSSNQDSCKKKN
jgi:hypothetical protein